MNGGRLSENCTFKIGTHQDYIDISLCPAQGYLSLKSVHFFGNIERILDVNPD